MLSGGLDCGPVAGRQNTDKQRTEQQNTPGKKIQAGRNLRQDTNHTNWGYLVIFLTHCQQQTRIWQYTNCHSQRSMPSRKMSALLTFCISAQTLWDVSVLSVSDTKSKAAKTTKRGNEVGNRSKLRKIRQCCQRKMAEVFKWYNSERHTW